MMRNRGFDGMCGGFGLKGSFLEAAFAALFFALAFLLCTPAYAADTLGDTNILVSFSAPGSAVRFIQDVEDGFLSLEKDVNFKVKAFVEPVTVSEETIYAQKELSIPEKEFVCREWPCSQTWDFDFSDQPVSLSEFPRLQIAWSQAVSESTPEIRMKAYITSVGGDGDNTNLIVHFDKKIEAVLQPVKTIDMMATEYVEKSTAYLARRELGFEADERWRYKQDGARLVLQARVDMPLKEVQAVQIFFDSHKIPEPEGVQFSVDTNGNGSRDSYILSGQTDHIRKKKGRSSIFTLDLRGAMKRLGIDPEKAVLMEPIIFLPTNFPAYKRDMPIEKIVFLGADITEDGEIDKLEVEKRGDLYSLEFDFSKALKDLSIWDAKLDILKIKIDLDGPQVVTWNRARLFDKRETQVPVLSNEPGKAFRGWVKRPEGAKEASFGFTERIEAFRPMWMQSFREASSADEDPLVNNAFLFPQKENSVVGKSPKSVAESRSGRRGLLTDDFVETVPWRSEKNIVEGSLYCWISGAMDNSVIQGEITVDHQSKTKTFPVNLLTGFNAITPRIQKETRIKNFKIKPPVYMHQGVLSLNVGLFDIQTGVSGEPFDYGNTEWWTKEAELLPLTINGKGYGLDEQQQRIFFFPGRVEGNTLRFTLPDQEFAQALEFILPAKLPQPCVATLRINDRNTPIPYGPYSLPLSSFGQISGEFEFTIEYLGEKEVIEMPIPRIKVMGLPHTPQDELKKIRVLINGKRVGLRVKNVPAPEGELVNMGSVTVEEGKHIIKVEESPFFRIKTLLLESDTPLPWLQEEETQLAATPLWKRMVLLGVKFLFVVALLLVVYLFRSKIRAFLGAIFRPVLHLFSKTYWRLPDLAWAIIWSIAGGGIYYLTGLMTKSIGENYGFSLGGIAVVLVIWHLSRVLKKPISRRFPNAAEYIYRRRETPFFASAIGLIVLTAVLVQVKLEPIAEQVAFVVYYLLVVGVVGEIFDLRKDGGPKAEDRGRKTEGRGQQGDKMFVC